MMDYGAAPLVLRKGLSLLLAPSGLVAACLFLGFLLWPVDRRRHLARTFFFTAFFLYAGLGNGPVSNLLLGGLESSSSVNQQDGLDGKAISSLVVLCGGVSYDQDRSLVDRLSPATRLRLLKAWSMVRSDSKFREVIVVGGCARMRGCPESEASLAGRWLQELGLPSGVRLVLEERSRNTEENLRNLLPLVGERPFCLVTSAVHMPRALILAKDLGLAALPVPCDFLAHRASSVFEGFWPSPGNLAKSDLAVHEYVGIAWLWARDHLASLRVPGYPS